MKRFAYLLIFIAGCSSAKPTAPAAKTPTSEAAATTPTKPAELPAPTKPAEKEPEKKEILTREELSEKVMGKTQDEVAQILGKADKVTSGRDAGEIVIVWEYNKVCQDKNSKNPDAVASLWFTSRSKVTNITFR